mmetsp:Transcript_21605/g.43333  ORF Transcript_21605/g.43333 Transcript_21605/m.43333 type:complete len:90 (+) Transcript_21605:67-336(+)
MAMAREMRRLAAERSVVIPAEDEEDIVGRDGSIDMLTVGWTKIDGRIQRTVRDGNPGVCEKACVDLRLCRAAIFIAIKIVLILLLVIDL